MSVGPIEYLVVAFPGNKFKGEIIPALAELVENETIRILDLVFIIKDEEGNVAAVELAEVDPEDEAAGMTDIASIDSGLLNEDDIAIAAEALDLNSSAGLLVFENVWATRFAEAVRNADGQLVANERIPYDVVQAALATRPPKERRAEMIEETRTGPGARRGHDCRRSRHRRRRAPPPGPEVRFAGSGCATTSRWRSRRRWRHSRRPLRPPLRPRRTSSPSSRSSPS